MHTYSRRTLLPVSPEELAAWHRRPGALERLTPPWQNVKVLERTGGIEPGSRVTLGIRVNGLPTTWTVEHRELEGDLGFRDVQLSGPFASWEHVHRFERSGEGSALEDSITYELPLGRVGAALGSGFAHDELDRAFRYRHAVTAWDLERRQPRPLTIAVTGATGLLGSALVPFLTAGGHSVVRISRGRPSASPGVRDVQWNPAAGVLERSELEGIDAVVHLAGENVGVRWTEERKRRIRDSRVQGTRLVADTIARLSPRPAVMVSMSAQGIYGDRGDEVLDESSESGSGWFAELGRDWEQAADGARDAGIRVVHPRLGLVLTPAGGALGSLLPIFQLGGGGPVGSGRQWWSWVSIEDVIGAIHAMLFDESLAGPVNVAAPSPVRNSEFVSVLGKVLHRPSLIPAPAFALRAMFGEMADEALLASQRMHPERLLATGFDFRHTELAEALRFVLGR